MRLRILTSFHYHRNTDLDSFSERLGGDVDLFADSGAYSAYASGAEIVLDDYIAWLHRWAHLFGTRANLDVIGDPAGTAENQRILTEAGLKVLPVFHLGEPFGVLESLCEEHDYVALGGLVPYLAAGAANANRRQMTSWMVKCHLIARKHGTVFHGFGCTGSLFLRDLPFYSADSSSYFFGRKFGLSYLWDERHLAMRSVHFRNPVDVGRWQHLFRKHGLEPGQLVDPTYMMPGTANFDEHRVEITVASLRAYMMMERSMVARHHVGAPDGAQDTGTKIYFVNISDKPVDIDPFRVVQQEAIMT